MRSHTDQERQGPIILVASRMFGLWSGRRELIEQLTHAGYSVILVAAADEYLERCAALGVRCVPVRIERSDDRTSDLAVIASLASLYRRERPSVIVHYNSKPVLLGSIAALATPSSRVVNVITGFGRSLDGSRWRQAILRGIYRAAGRRAAVTVFQNSDDAQFAAANGLVPAPRARTIVSSGVDVIRFSPGEVSDRTDAPVVLLVSRLLWSKGVGDFVAAAAIVRRSHPTARFLIGGEFEQGHRDAVPRAWIDEQTANGTIEFIGYVSDMAMQLRRAEVFVLPSRYREGVPRVVIEAMATGLPVIAVDAPGARDVITDGITGFLVQASDVTGLASRIGDLLDDRERASAIGSRARDSVVASFSRSSVTGRMFSLICGHD